MKRILALDYGREKIGVAISDPLKIIAKPLMVIINSSSKNVLDEINKLIHEFEVETIAAVSMPTLKKNKYSKQTEIVVKFVKFFRKKLKINIETYDERLTSQMAQKILITQGIKTGHNKQEIDKVSAAIFLQNFLDDSLSSYILVLLSAVLVGVSQHSNYLGFLSWFGLVPFLSIIFKENNFQSNKVWTFLIGLSFNSCFWLATNIGTTPFIAFVIMILTVFVLSLNTVFIVLI